MDQLLRQGERSEGVAMDFFWEGYDHDGDFPPRIHCALVTNPLPEIGWSTTKNRKTVCFVVVRGTPFGFALCFCIQPWCLDNF